MIAPKDVTFDDIRHLLEQPDGAGRIFYELPLFGSRGLTANEQLQKEIDIEWRRRSTALVGSDGELFDAAHERVFAAIPKAAEAVPNLGAFRGYLICTIKNACNSVFRRKAWVTRADNITTTGQSRIEKSDESSTSDNAEMQAMKRQRRGLVDQALEELSQHHPLRALIIDREFLQDMSPTQIQRELEIPQSTYFYNRDKALKDLRRIIGKDFNPRDLIFEK